MHLLSNPILRLTTEARVSAVRRRFTQLQTAPDSTCLALSDYCDRIPHRFFSEVVRDEYSSWIAAQSRNQLVLRELQNEAPLLGRAFRSLEEINGQDWHDAVVDSEPDELVLLDRAVHPAYLRLTESVLHPFLVAAAKVSRLMRRASTGRLDAFNVVQELRTRGLAVTCSVYDNVLRNAIAHGGIDYRDHSVFYSDRNATRELAFREVLRATDDLLDTCNALALSLKSFFFTSGLPPTSWPREVLLQELQVSAAAPWWTVRACLVSQSRVGSQLNVYAEATTRDWRKVLYSAMQSGVLAEHSAPGFDRYFVSFRGPAHQVGWAAFDGTRLANLRQDGASELSQFVPALEKDIGVYLHRRGLPSLLSRLDTMIASFKLNAAHARRAYRQALHRPDVTVRESESHTDPKLVRKAWVVVPNPTVALIHENAGWILELVAAAVRRRNRLRSMRPLGVAHVSLFARDYRLRRLKSYGLGADLIGTLSQYRDSRKTIIDIFGSRVEVMHGIRIAWNSNWPGLGDHLAS